MCLAAVAMGNHGYWGNTTRTCTDWHGTSCRWKEAPRCLTKMQGANFEKKLWLSNDLAHVFIFDIEIEFTKIIVILFSTEFDINERLCIYIFFYMNVNDRCSNFKIIFLTNQLIIMIAKMYIELIIIYLYTWMKTVLQWKNKHALVSCWKKLYLFNIKTCRYTKQV